MPVVTACVCFDFGAGGTKLHRARDQAFFADMEIGGIKVPPRFSRPFQSSTCASAPPSIASPAFFNSCRLRLTWTVDRPGGAADMGLGEGQMKGENCCCRHPCPTGWRSRRPGGAMRGLALRAADIHHPFAGDGRVGGAVAPEGLRNFRRAGGLNAGPVCGTHNMVVVLRAWSPKVTSGSIRE